MKILCLCKRQYTHKDVLDDRYGRLFEIPESLAGDGHDVVALTLSYRWRDALTNDAGENPCWHSVNAIPAGIIHYPIQLFSILHAFRPDIIWVSSDAFHAIVGAIIQKFFKIPVVIDLYDNYESFAATRLPGVRLLLRAACRRVAGLTVVSRSLRDFVLSDYRINSPVKVVCNGVNQQVFYPYDPITSRVALHLPVDGRLIGTAGAITENRGISDLFEAFLLVAATDPSVYLVFAGPRDGTPARFVHPRIIDLGILSTDQIPLFYSALDVAVVCNLDSDFGRYCFPQKLQEIIACRTPVVAACVGDAVWDLRSHQQSLYRPGDIGYLAEAIRIQLVNPILVTEYVVPDWRDLSDQLSRFFVDLVGHR